ncbi:MAG TPA: DegV family protein [Aggregatilineales bacterium]|nr:DegV family protein [Aggregatilineales bacterium]
MGQAKVKLVVDSSADMPAEWLERWDLRIIPCFINFGTESYPDDGVSLPRSEFYKKLATSPVMPKTSAPAPGVAAEIIRQQLAKAEHVIAFTVAHQFSSVYNSVRLAGDQVDPKRVTVIDTGQVSAALGFMVEAAALTAELGAGVDEILAAVQSVRERVRLIAALDTLEYLRRSGRVNTLVASIGTMLQVKLIIGVHEGEVQNLHRVRTMTKAKQTMIEVLRADLPIERLAVLHTNCPEGGEALREQVADIAPAFTPILDITTTVGTHVGPGCLGFSWVRKNK